MRRTGCTVDIAQEHRLLLLVMEVQVVFGKINTEIWALAARALLRVLGRPEILRVFAKSLPMIGYRVAIRVQILIGQPPIPFKY